MSSKNILPVIYWLDMKILFLPLQLHSPDIFILRKTLTTSLRLAQIITNNSYLFEWKSNENIIKSKCNPIFLWDINLQLLVQIYLNVLEHSEIF